MSPLSPTLALRSHISPHTNADDSWCPSCRTFTPLLESIVEEEEGRINVVRVEIDEGECAELATRYQVWSGEVWGGEADGRLRVFRRLLRFEGDLGRWNSYRGID